MTGVPEDDYRVLNTEATIGLARAARRAGAKRFIFLSSIRAQCGPTAEMVLTETLEPRPTDAYGRSKLAAERRLAELDIDWVSLRATLVYGPGVRGNMARLIRLARSPLPLPLARFKGRRSLLALENLSAAIGAVLAVPGPLRRVVIAADPQALTVAEMIAAMRGGLGRRASVFPLPPRLLEILLRAAGQREIYDRMSGSLVAHPSVLTSLGWRTFNDAGRRKVKQLEVRQRRTAFIQPLSPACALPATDDPQNDYKQDGSYQTANEHVPLPRTA
jgi:UDP-glucose 4-epimerase